MSRYLTISHTGPSRLPLALSFFRQQAGRFMDLAPEAIGGNTVTASARCPAIQRWIAGRLAEVTGRPAEAFPDEVLQQMIRLMRRDLRAGKRIIYNDPKPLMELLVRASAP